jgi:nicotinamide mononucleotide transporter
VYYYLLVYFGGDRPLLDAILTATSLTATYMMTKKWVENWLAWTFIDGTYILLYGLKGMWLFCLLYFLFTIIAFFGYLKWRKTV